MPKPKVFVFAPVQTGLIGDTLEKLAARGCEITEGSASWYTPEGNSEAEMCAMAKGADALMGTSIRSSPITRTIMQASDKLRIVAKYTIGVDDVEVDAATELGILVTHSPTESNWGGVAEGTMALMLALLKKVRERDAAMKQGKWRDAALQGTYLGNRLQDGAQGITIGIVGMGRIGRRLAELLQPWRVRILAHDPYVEKARFTLSNVIETDLDTLLRESDVVSLHVTLNATSQGLINGQSLSQMKRTAVLINTSRGPVVEERSLIAALQNGTIAGAALDVYEQEPLPADSPIRKLGDKVLLSAHMVTANASSGIKPGAIWASRSVEAALKGEVPDNVFNTEVIPRWRQRFAGKSLLE